MRFEGDEMKDEMNGDGDRDRVADVPTLQIARTFKIYTNI